MSTISEILTADTGASERNKFGLSGTVKKDLLGYLDDIAAPGDFATTEKLDTIVDPDIKILRNGSTDAIAVPLAARDALKIIDAARQAPFGKGEDTLVDTSVRNTWELDLGQFSLSDRWQPYVDKLARSACHELGVRTPDTKAELYKMLLYEKGAMFKPHTDSEKVPGMFGTLVISLPSAHFGGAVVLSHNGKQHVFQTSYHEYLAW